MKHCNGGLDTEFREAALEEGLLTQTSQGWKRKKDNPRVGKSLGKGEAKSSTYMRRREGE